MNMTRVLPFFLMVPGPDITSNPEFHQYGVITEDLPHVGTFVHRPLWMQRICSSMQSLSHEILSPSVLADDLGTFWNNDRGLLYFPDFTSYTRDLQRQSQRDGYGYRTNKRNDKVEAVVVTHQDRTDWLNFARHRIGMDGISGLSATVRRRKIVLTFISLP